VHGPERGEGVRVAASEELVEVGSTRLFWVDDRVVSVPVGRLTEDAEASAEHIGVGWNGSDAKRTGKGDRYREEPEGLR
jgi:hypothetical protein